MGIFTNKNIKALFCAISICIIVFALISVFLIIFEVKNAAVFIFICGIALAIAVLINLYRYFNKQNKIIENAQTQIAEYISGNQNARIDCDDEGELNKLFHEVNTLASILNAHTEQEIRSKEFLKITISDISHQLKTPLAALNIYNGIMQDDTTDFSEIKKFSALSEKELDRIEVLVQNLLKITKLDAGTIAIDRKNENVYKILEDIKNRFSFRAKQEDKQLILTGDTSAEFLCDRVWLTEAIQNIVKNALDHTSNGDKISIECKNLSSIIQITIQDSGSGIHPEDLHHIFKRFYRSRFSNDTQGIGLGLPLAKSIIEAHNGTIEVDSEFGKGTTFTINFIKQIKISGI